MQYTGFSPTRELEAFRNFNFAEDLDDFKAGLHKQMKPQELWKSRPEYKEFLWKALLDGKIDHVVTDHACVYDAAKDAVFAHASTRSTAMVPSP